MRTFRRVEPISIFTFWEIYFKFQQETVSMLSFEEVGDDCHETYFDLTASQSLDVNYLPSLGFLQLPYTTKLSNTEVFVFNPSNLWGFPRPTGSGTFVSCRVQVYRNCPGNYVSNGLPILLMLNTSPVFVMMLH